MEARKDIFGQLDALDNGKPFAKARDVDAVVSAVMAALQQAHGAVIRG